MSPTHEELQADGDWESPKSAQQHPSFPPRPGCYLAIAEALEYPFFYPLVPSFLARGGRQAPLPSSGF